MTETLFDVDSADVLPALPAPGKSPGVRLTERQAAAIAAGYHPLLLMVYGPKEWAKLHPDAKREYLRGQRSAPFTCGSCRFRVVDRWHNATYAKCMIDVLRTDAQLRTLDESPRASHSAATDVRAGWPACRDYQAGANDLSPDASRVIP